MNRLGACEALARSLIKANKSTELSCWVNRAIGHIAAGNEANRERLGAIQISMMGDTVEWIGVS